MSTQQKIKGFIEHHEAYKPGVGPDRLLFVRDNGENEANATLVLGGGSVFTETEFAKLKAHADRLLRWSTHRHDCLYRQSIIGGYDTTSTCDCGRDEIIARYRADFPADAAGAEAR